MISIIIHVIMCLLLNKHIITKKKQYVTNTTDNKSSINTFIQTPNTEIEKKKNQDQSNRFKITETQRKSIQNNRNTTSIGRTHNK
ncbi:hypothetical protein [Candidatus Blochmannia sp. SNP]|uniref:hypothetical protein n=1 Tax=Candidatus Blochmannia sp. SNP TaxID=3118169 RepID=UPI002F92839C